MRKQTRRVVTGHWSHARASIGAALVIGALVAALTPPAAHAQATRTWVSGTGDDVNPCSRTAPCRTLAGAIEKTAAGGEIDALDPGPLGAVTITKAITIDATGTTGGILHAGGNGIRIDAGPTDDVVLRGLHINGTGASPAPACPNITGTNGILLEDARSLRVDDSKIYRNTTAGVLLAPETTDAKVVLDGVDISEGCQDGINAAPAPGRKVNVMVRDTTISNTQTALRAAGGAYVGLVDSAIFGNGTGLLTTGGGIIDSLGGNAIFGNVVNGTPSNAPPPPSPVTTRTTPPPPVVRCTVPRLAGLRLSTARRRLARANCRLGSVRRRTTKSRRRVGRVLSQRIGAGRTLPKDATVGVTVGRRAKRR